MKKEDIKNITSLENKLIAFPTDTVYGVGALINDLASINKIYELKQRDLNKPLAVLVGKKEDAYKLLNNLPKKAKDLIDKYWPGALTIICKKNENVPSFLNPKFSTIGIRMPNNKIALEILNKFGPLATTSINISGEEPLNDYEEIFKKFNNKIDYIFENDETSSNVSSTVIEIKNDEIILVRKGSIKVY